MNIKDVAGFVVYDYRRRENYRQFYYKKDQSQGSHSTLLLMTGGKAVFDFGGARLSAGKGALICFGPGELKESYPTGRVPVSFHIINFDAISADGGKLGRAELGLSYLIDIKSPRRIRAMFERIFKAFQSRGTKRVSDCSALGIRLLQAIAHDKGRGAEKEPDEAAPLHFRIKNALEYIRRNFKARLDVASLARQACMHPVYFTQLFKREIGVPPHRYIMEYKIEKAKEFIGAFNEALDYTSNELGFHDYSHFYRVFKKITGLSPMQFIKKQKGLYDPR